MSDQNRNSMNEKDFDFMLQNSMPEFLPDEVVNSVTPWRKAMNRILAGMAMNMVTLNFCLLNYILPLIGLILSLLGFRMLRKENRWFKAGWVITLIRTGYCLPTLILNATIFQKQLYASPGFIVLREANVVLMFLLLFCLWKGFRSVRIKVGLPAHAGGAAALIVWYGVVCVLGILQFNVLMIGLMMVISYGFILRSLFKLSRELDEAGYAVRTGVVRVPDWVIVTAILGILAVGIGCGYRFFSCYPMDWQVMETADDPKTEEIRKHLISLGFPESILEDLSEEDIKACDGALRVVVTVHDYPVDSKRIVQVSAESGTGQDTVYYVRKLRITGIGVEVPGEREQWKIFHHFLWMPDQGFYGTESIQLWTAYRVGEGWAAAGEITGHVLCDKEGQVYTAPYYFLGSETYTSDSVFRGEQTSTDVFAAFSMPKDGENHRGYVSYSVAELRDGWIIDAGINYTHQTGWWHYPAVTAMENRMSGSWNINDGFMLIQDALQFFPNKDNTEPFN